MDEVGALAVRDGVGADDAGDLGEGVGGRQVGGVDERVLDGERVGVAQVGGPVSGLPHEGDEPHVAVVVLAGRERVGAQAWRVGGRREAEGAEGAVPGGAVVEARLPRVADGDEAAGAEVAAAGEVAVLGVQLRVEVREERPAGLQVGGAFVQAEGREGVQGRLGEAGGLDAVRGVRLPFAVPQVRAREERVPVEGRVEHDVGEHPVRPLAAEEGEQLGLGPVAAVAGEPHADEGRVPAPLVRVEARRGGGGGPGPVGVEDPGRGVPQRGLVAGETGAHVVQVTSS
ncbi:hypothetical protein LUX39_45755 [Actinomadura madurae]|nr:hypothetical protein [Actinomadura madurae]MCQ0020135.1 hypothetical protein [Actinomadura madurae]